MTLKKVELIKKVDSIFDKYMKALCEHKRDENMKAEDSQHVYKSGQYQEKDARRPVKAPRNCLEESRGRDDKPSKKP